MEIDELAVNNVSIYTNTSYFKELTQVSNLNWIYIKI